MIHIGLKTGRDLDSGPDFFVDDLVFPVGGGRDDLDRSELLEPFDNGGRIFATAKHDFGDFFLGLADKGDSEGAKANAKNGEEQERHEYRGDDRAAVADGFREFLAIDDADVANGHVSWPPRRRSGE